MSAGRKIDLLIILLSLTLLTFISRIHFTKTAGEIYKYPIDGDAKGYYAYLPAIFIYHDLTFSFLDKLQPNEDPNYSRTFLADMNEHRVNKYPCGESLLLLPFFLLAVLYSWICGLPIDGYSPSFHFCCLMGSWLYFVCGLIFTKRFLQKYSLSPTAVMLSLTGIAIGTNLLNYVANESCMSHSFSFCLVALHIFFVKDYFDSLSIKKIILAGISLGLIVLVRPVNGLIILSYPFLAGGLPAHWRAIRIKDLLIFTICATVVTFIQLIVWKITSGRWIIFGYKNEGFYFDHPQVLNYLFGCRRGTFVYSPVLLLALPGFFILGKKGTAWLLFFLLTVIYIHASWWSWYYGDGFGERPLIDFYVFFALLLGFTFNSAKKRWSRLSLSVCFFTFVALHLVFFYQYLNGIIHPYSMNAERFATVFLNTSDKYRDLFKSDPEDFYHPHGVRTIDSLFHALTDTNFTPGVNFRVNKKNIVPGEYLKATEPQPYLYQLTADSSWLSKTRYVEIDFDYMQLESDSAASHSLSFVTVSLLKTKGFYYNAYPASDHTFNTPGVWKHDFERMPVIAPENPGDLVQVYMENRKRKDLCIKNLSIKIVEAKP